MKIGNRQLEKNRGRGNLKKTCFERDLGWIDETSVKGSCEEDGDLEI